MTAWGKLAEDIARNPRVLAACRANRSGDPYTLWTALISLHVTYGDSGRLPGEVVEPQAITQLCPCMWLTASEVTSAMDALKEAELISTDEGGLQLLGYDEDWMVQCSSCHRPNPRPRNATCPECRAKRSARTQQGPDGDGPRPGKRPALLPANGPQRKVRARERGKSA